MNRSLLAGAVLGSAAVLTVGAIAGYQAIRPPAFATVLSTTPIKEKVKTPVQECAPVTVTRRRAPQDEHRIVGTVVGGVVGGVLGHQVGEGRGKDLATIAGAAGGAYAGNRVQKSLQDRDTVSATEQRCRTVMRASENVVGYDVKYELEGVTGTVRTKVPPGHRLPVKDGVVVTDSAVADAR